MTKTSHMHETGIWCDDVITEKRIMRIATIEDDPVAPKDRHIAG